VCVLLESWSAIRLMECAQEVYLTLWWSEGCGSAEIYLGFFIRIILFTVVCTVTSYMLVSLSLPHYVLVLDKENEKQPLGLEVRARRNELPLGFVAIFRLPGVGVLLCEPFELRVCCDRLPQ
jgi:hypothetical protein